MTITRVRLALLAAAILTLGACGAESPTSPTTRLSPTAVTRDIGDSIPDPLCKSGYSNPNGRCID
jgi:hypothetical protein